MKPYYEHAGITIYHGDCREILPGLPQADLILTDPPYGINADIGQELRANTQRGKALALSKSYGKAQWDSVPPDPWVFGLIRHKSKKQIVWGGNFFGLGPSRGWLVWDKDNGENRYADCELAWTNLDIAVRRFRFRWMGMLQEHMEQKEQRFHPTQKPVPLMTWCLRIAETRGPIVDPYAGVGTSLIAAKHMQISAIGIEIEERYCEIAAKRLGQEVFDFTEEMPA